VVTSWDLHKAFPEAEYVSEKARGLNEQTDFRLTIAAAFPQTIIPDAGHSANEEGITKALIAATDKFATL
jgi:hypothetical protein